LKEKSWKKRMTQANPGPKKTDIELEGPRNTKSGTGFTLIVRTDPRLTRGILFARRA
jgi:hypothetical protein